MNTNLLSAVKYLIAVVIAVFFCLWSMVAGVPISHLLELAFADIDTDQYLTFGDLYNQSLVIGVAVGGALSLVVFWIDGPGKRDTAFWINVLILILILPLVFANYWALFIFISRWKQACLDFAITTLGVLLLIRLLAVKTKSTELNLLKGAASFLIATQAVLVPAVYFILWLFNSRNSIMRASTEDWFPNWITGFAAIGGLIISLVNYNRRYKA